MHQANAQQPAALLDAEPLGQVQRVIVSVPRENPALAEKCSHFRRRILPKPHGNGRTALPKSLRIPNPEETQSWNLQQALDQLCQQSRFVLMCGPVSRQQRTASMCYGRVATPSQLRNVVYRCADSRDLFLHLRAGLPAVGKSLRRGPHLIGLESQQVLALSIQGPHM